MLPCLSRPLGASPSWSTFASTVAALSGSVALLACRCPEAEDRATQTGVVHTLCDGLAPVLERSPAQLPAAAPAEDRKDSMLPCRSVFMAARPSLDLL